MVMSISVALCRKINQHPYCVSVIWLCFFSADRLDGKSRYR
jgi:hypothetical protein